ncbi:MAG: hypothetical protein HKN32_08010, partial [Flavobacteriales bacterium]|nr:hypothetical protein [Flavobacteriales bacterium]
YLDRSLDLDPSVRSDVDFFYGQIHHRLAKLDESIQYFLAFLAHHTGVQAGIPKSDDYAGIREFLEKVDNRHWNDFDNYMARKHVNQCLFAKEEMANPAPVVVANMGRAVNSRFDDYTPSVSANGKLIIFTSRRSDTKGGEIDEGGDFKYFEDIYYSEWDEEKMEWTKSRGVEGEVNTPTYDAVLSLSPGADRMFIYKNNRESAGDIFTAVYDKHAQEWRAPEKLPRPINTSYYEGSVSITADGETLYFISERPEGVGQGDIYIAEKRGEGWSAPRNLGEVINTDFDEKFVFIHPNGRTLYFSSNGHQTMGSYDIFKSEKVNGEWGVPVNLGYAINTVNEESTFSITRDNKTMLVAAEYEDTFGERDIYTIDVSKYKMISEGYESSTFGTVVCTVLDDEGDRLRKVDVRVFGSTGDRMITETRTDKVGLAKISLPGNRSYRFVLEYKDIVKEIVVDLTMKEGDTVKKVEVTMD